MRTVVLEIRDGKACVLSNDGIVRIVDDCNYQVGQVLELTLESLKTVDTDSRKSLRYRNASKVERQTFYKRAAGIAASIFLLFGVGSAAAYAAPVSSVSLDINPSLSYQLNVFDRVIALKAYNDDGAQIAETMNDRVKGHKIDEAISITLDELSREDYIQGPDTPAVFTVSSVVRHSQQVLSTLMDEIGQWNEKQIADMDDEGEADVSTVDPTAVVINRKFDKEAKEKQVSPGKLYMAEQLKKLMPQENSPDESELINESIEELDRQMKQYKTIPSGGGESFDENSGRKQENSADDSVETSASPQTGQSGQQRREDTAEQNDRKQDADGNSQMQQGSAPAGNSQPQQGSAPAGNSQMQQGSAPAGNSQSQQGSAPAGNSQPQQGSAPAGNSQSQQGSAPAGNSQSQQGSAPAGNSQSQQGSAPAGNSQPQQGSAPAGNSQPQQGSAPAENSQSQQGSAPGGNSQPQQGSAPVGNSQSQQGSAPAGNSQSQQGSAPGGNSQPQQANPTTGQGSVPESNSQMQQGSMPAATMQPQQGGVMGENSQPGQVSPKTGEAQPQQGSAQDGNSRP